MLIKNAPRVLAIGAHPDDIELGAGGFLNRLMKDCSASVHFLILTEGLEGLPGGGAYQPSHRQCEAQAAAEILGASRADVDVLSFPDCHLHEHGHELIRAIERHLFDREGAPQFDVVLTHSGEDTHADHRAAHEATLSAVRNFHGTLLFYQSPSSKPNGFHPTFFVKLDESNVNYKCAAIFAHLSQRDRQYTTVSRTLSMASNWSVFLRQPTGAYLEAFEVYKAFY